jgi:hypothetical protein
MSGRHTKAAESDRPEGCRPDQPASHLRSHEAIPTPGYRGDKNGGFDGGVGLITRRNCLVFNVV